MGIKIKTYQFIFSFVVLINFQCYSQAVDSSKIKTHTVQNGETSYGIAKKYQLDLNLFFQYNPEAAKGINKGQILKIPYVHIDKKSLAREGFQKDTNLIRHKVKHGETLWSVAKLYGVQVKVIKVYNNLKTNIVDLNQNLLIPNLRTDTNNIVNPLVKHPAHPLLSPCDTLIIHKVKKKETLYGIANFYNIGIDKIIKTNPILSEKGLRKDQLLKIVYRITDCNEDSLKKYTDTIVSVTHSQFVNNNLNVSILLPFMLDDTDSLLFDCEDPSICPLSKNTINSLHIFNGIKIALSELKLKGYNLNINVYDTKYDTSEVKMIISDSIFRKSHLVIGPLYSRNIKLIRSFARLRNIPMITSFDLPNQALFRFPSIYKFYPSRATLVKKYAKYLTNKKSDYNVILIANKDYKKSVGYSKVFSKTYNDTLTVNDSIFEIDSINPILLKRGDKFSSVTNKLLKKDTNLIVLTAYDIPFMTYVFNKVIEMSNSKDFFKYKFAITGFEDIFNMNTTDDIYKNKFNLQFISKGLIDYEEYKTLEFIDTYRTNFEMEPDKLSFIAFDMVMSIFNKVYPSKLETEEYDGLYNNVNFEKIGPNSGFENKSIKIFRYNNYKVHQILEN